MNVRNWRAGSRESCHDGLEKAIRAGVHALNQPTVLIAGATGAAASRLMTVLAAEYRVVGLCRTPPGSGYVAADLSDPASCRAALASVGPVTHLVYAARAPFGEGGVEDVPANRAYLANLLDAAETPALRHVHLVEGTKWYGMHLGAFPTPAQEDDPRHLPPNFYYDQQDLLAARAAAGGWHWTASRPAFIVDFAPNRARNLISSIGAYAALCRAAGTPFDFPGAPGAYDRLLEMTGATQLARAIRWMFATPSAANQAFNITNGDLFRWSRLWPRLADYFALPRGTVRPLPLARWMADKEPLWQSIVARHGLLAQPLSAVARWDFLDFALGLQHDVACSMNRARLAGFHDTEDTTAMFCRHLDAYRAARILP
jgi:nucleoside-diphosphate-sugar epimerase